MSKIRLQYLWIEKWRNIENTGFTFSNQFYFSYNEKGKLNYKDNSENYVSYVFGKNIDLTAVVGNNGAGKTSLLEFIMQIVGRGEISTNFIVVFCYDDSSMKAYHTGILSDFDGEIIELSKNSNGNWVIPTDLKIPTIYYTSAFNYEQYNQNYNIHNLSPAYMFKHCSYIAVIDEKENRRVTDISEYYQQVINKQLEFIYSSSDVFELFEIRKPRKFIIHYNDSTNGLSNLIEKYEEKKKDAIDTVRKDKHRDIIYERYKEYVDECEKLEKEVNIKYLHDNFFTVDFDGGMETFVVTISNELMSNFITELISFNPFLFSGMPTSLPLFRLIGYINKIYLDSQQDQSSIGLLKRMKLFFDNFKDFAIETEIHFLGVPNNKSGGKWRFFYTENYGRFVDFLLDFIDKSGENVNWELDHQILINIVKEKDSDIDVIKFYNEYARISKISNFLSFSYGLSSGEMALLNLYAGIFKAVKDIQDKKRNDNEIDNLLILIDEADMLLHPEWQQKYINSLINFLSSKFSDMHLQILVATHSPIMLSDIPKQNTLYLTKHEDTTQPETFSANIFQLFRYSFFLDESAIGVFAENKLKDIIHRIDTIDQNVDNNLDQKTGLLANEIKLIGDPLLRRKIEERYYSKLANIRELSNEDKIKELQNQVKVLQKQIAKLEENGDNNE